jgi:hypothetical protein
LVARVSWLNGLLKICLLYFGENMGGTWNPPIVAAQWLDASTHASLACLDVMPLPEVNICTVCGKNSSFKLGCRQPKLFSSLCTTFQIDNQLFGVDVLNFSPFIH